MDSLRISGYVEGLEAAIDKIMTGGAHPASEMEAQHSLGANSRHTPKVGRMLANIG